MFGCESCAAMRASRTNRSWKTSSPVSVPVAALALPVLVVFGRRRLGAGRKPLLELVRDPLELLEVVGRHLPRVDRVGYGLPERGGLIGRAAGIAGVEASRHLVAALGKRLRDGARDRRGGRVVHGLGRAVASAATREEKRDCDARRRAPDAPRANRATPFP